MTALIAAVLAAGCGAGMSAAPAGPFAWLHPGPPPSTWSTARLAGTTILAYPAGWKRIRTDPGTASAALTGPDSGVVMEYLNATPQQGEETLQNWSSFRPAHNREEGDTDERVLAAARGLRFRDGHGSCVIDRYRTSRTAYQEIACLVHGPAGTTVIVAAAQTARWAQAAPVLERAVSAFLA